VVKIVEVILNYFVERIDDLIVRYAIYVEVFEVSVDFNKGSMPRRKGVGDIQRVLYY